MNQAFYSGFVKEALNMPQLHGGHAAIALGVALSGLAVYDFFKGSKFPTVTKEDLKGLSKDQVASAQHLRMMLKAKPLRRPPVVVTKIEQLEGALKKGSFTAHERVLIRNFAKTVLAKENNAFVVPSEAKDILVMPPKLHKHVVEHELGHLRDFEKTPFKKPGFLKSLLALVWKPSYKKLVLDREERAWKHSRAKKLKTKAVGSYERGFHVGRGSLATGGAIWSGITALEQMRKAQHAKHRPQIPRT